MLDILPAQTKFISCSRYKVVLTKMSEIFIILLLTKLFLHIYLVKLTCHVEKDRKSWYQLDRILGQEGADTRTSGHFYITVIQAILLFGLEIWVVTLRIKRLLGGFHHRVARGISGKIPRRWAEGRWEYPLWGTQ